MQTFTVGLGRTWWTRLSGRSPLMRPVDCAEAWITVFACLLIVVAVPVVGAIGTAAYDARAHSYVEQAKHRHQVTATAIDDSNEIVVSPSDVLFDNRATWKFAGRDHAKIIEWPDKVNIGDTQLIWVDDDGNKVLSPHSTGRAAAEAIAIAVSVWLTIVAGVAGGLWVLRQRVERSRYAQWDHELLAPMS